MRDYVRPERPIGSPALRRFLSGKPDGTRSKYADDNKQGVSKSDDVSHRSLFKHKHAILVAYAVQPAEMTDGFNLVDTI